jgi:hypothetical protein
MNPMEFFFATPFTILQVSFDVLDILNPMSPIVLIIESGNYRQMPSRELECIDADSFFPCIAVNHKALALL